MKFGHSVEHTCITASKHTLHNDSEEGAREETWWEFIIPCTATRAVTHITDTLGICFRFYLFLTMFIDGIIWAQISWSCLAQTFAYHEMSSLITNKNRITNQFSTWFSNNSWIPVSSIKQQMEIRLVISCLANFSAQQLFDVGPWS